LPANGVGKWLVNDAVANIGRFSFSIYLLHFLFLSPAMTLSNRMSLTGTAAFAFQFFSVAIAAVTVSALTYRFIERP
jgi:peptidoglycan/LPS O-acetylase OafA/YrhL